MSKEQEFALISSLMLFKSDVTQAIVELGFKPMHMSDTAARFCLETLLNNSDSSYLTLLDAVNIKNSPIDVKFIERLERGEDRYATPLVGKIIKGIIKDYQKSGIKSACAMSSAMIDEGDTPEDVLGQLQGSLIELANTEVGETKATMANGIMEEYEACTAGDITGIPTPFPKMDRYSNGLNRRMVTPLCGRSGKGKSFLVCNWLVRLGRLGVPALYFALEDKDISVARCAASVGGYSHMNIIRFGLNSTNRGKVESSLREVQNMPIYFETRRVDINQLRSTCYMHTAEHGIQAVFIDGFKDISRPFNKYNDTGYEEFLSQQICDIADRLDLAIIPVMHITKIDQEAEIQLTNIRGSSLIVADARMVLGLQDSGFTVKPPYVQTPDTMRFDVMKNNHGREGATYVISDLDHSRFYEQEIGNGDGN